MKIVIQHLTGISDATAHALLDSFPGAAERLNERAWVVRHTLFTAAQKRELITQQERDQASEAMAAIYDLIRVDAFDAKNIEALAEVSKGKLKVVERP